MFTQAVVYYKEDVYYSGRQVTKELDTLTT